MNNHKTYPCLIGIFANIANIGKAANNDPKQWDGIQERHQLYTRVRSGFCMGLRLKRLFWGFREDGHTNCLAKT